MPKVHLSGRLICSTGSEAFRVRRHLTDHIRQTRAEPGCLRFDIDPDPNNPLAWIVTEVFSDRAAFNRHQERSKNSTWGQATAGIRREYKICSPGEPA